MNSIVVAIAKHNVIGSKNDLPWYLPADLKRFKEITAGKTVVMGRKTFDSIIARLGHPLPDRQSIVITRQKDFLYPGVKVIRDITELPDEDLFVIGGAEIYRLLLSRVDKLYLTEVDADIDGDVYFPELDINEWQELSREPHPKDDKNQYDFNFVIYKRT